MFMTVVQSRPMRPSYFLAPLLTRENPIKPSNADPNNHAAPGIGTTDGSSPMFALIQPLSQPDPWASRIGGPGGPQYPIDETDDYGVSI